MSDRQLLEDAAKAAGIDATYDEKWGGMLLPVTVEEPDDGYEFWNPLTDDGDALRLAVKLRIMVDPDGESYAVATACPKGRGEFTASEKHRDNPFAATRRAIVRAAAELGRAAAAISSQNRGVE